jgi:hypothetical protein
LKETRNSIEIEVLITRITSSPVWHQDQEEEEEEEETLP